ncbi:aldo/keto reductase [Nonomuraea sp. MCN248]|uniref:Aldo/keto reductase n=1 Tax=Nonomuraea corallina TaxID=2989783 RepID=A0ABT4S6G9_9ACTN|nr:aldo/keto reductase [Nonomuraea corallina]MDA0632740.1 aldo/keto reductase [Nonomuraea corallina]
MDVRRLGRAGPISSAIGLGGTALAGGPDVRAGAQVIGHALDLGITLLDTTSRSRQEQVQQLAGRAIAGRRQEVVLAARARAGGGGLARSCDAALRRLAVDHLDLLYLDCPAWPGPVEDGVGELARLVTAGKVRHLGLAEPRAWQIGRAAAEHAIAAIACEYSLWDRRAELDRIPAARAHRIGVVACRPLGLGAGPGPGGVRPSGDDPRAAVRAVRTAEEVAAQLHLSLARLALVWLLAQGGDIVPVPSTRNRVHLEMNASTAGVQVDLAPLARLNTLFPPH